MVNETIESSRQEKIEPQFKWFLTLAMVLATYQLFVPLLVTYLPLALIFSFLCIKFVRINKDDHILFLFFIFYLGNVLVSFQWSSDKGAWISSVVYGFLFFLGYFSTKSFRDRSGSESTLSRILYLFLIFACINAILVIIFRVLPEVESYFWSSGLMGLFKSPKRLVNIGFFKPNVFDINKSGGVFDNANTGAAFNLLCFGATICLQNNLSRIRFFTFILLFSFAILASGSKSAIAILLLMGGIMSLSIFLSKNKAIWQFFFGYFLIGVIAFVLFFWGEITSFVNTSSFMAESLRTMTYRSILWDVAIQQIERHPYFGLGYGGWGDAIAPYKLMLSGQTLPPHNSLISAWIDTGIIAPISITIIWLICFIKLLLAYLKSPNVFQLGVMFSFVSVAAMSMGDTFSIFGNPNIAFPLGFLVAYGLQKTINKT